MQVTVSGLYPRHTFKLWEWGDCTYYVDRRQDSFASPRAEGQVRALVGQVHHCRSELLHVQEAALIQIR